VTYLVNCKLQPVETQQNLLSSDSVHYITRN